MSPVAVIDVFGCPRCGGNHSKIPFARFTRNVEVPDVTFTHWAPCPSSPTVEPILLYFSPDPQPR